MTLYGCETHPELCEGGGGGSGGGSGGGDGGVATDPNPSAAGYWMGTTVTPDRCFSESGIGINDIDLDGMDDNCEQHLAERFRPVLATQQYDCNVGREPYWAAKWFPSTGAFVRIAYLFAYYQDCGSDSPAATVGDFIFTKTPLMVIHYASGGVTNWEALGTADEPFTHGHQGDSEFMIVDVGYSESTQHWQVKGAFLSAHYGNAGDHSEYVPAGLLESPDGYGGYPRVWVSEGKHANYRSREHCQSATMYGLRSEDCYAGSVIYTRLEFNGTRNVGSFMAPLPAPEGCVQGGLLHSIYPYLYGTECFWRKNTTFAGWSPVGQGTDATPYRSILMRAFECLYQADPDIHDYTCPDMGVQREPY